VICGVAGEHIGQTWFNADADERETACGLPCIRGSVISTETFVYLRLEKQTYAWGVR
jgi:hypothetical protein